MTPEEIKNYIDRSKAEHEQAVGYPPNPVATPAPSRPAVMPNLTEIRQEHNELLGELGSPQSPLLSWPTSTGDSKADSAARVQIAASETSRAPTGGSFDYLENNDPTTWTRETAKALDLTDAMRIGTTSQDTDEINSLGGVSNAAAVYMQKLNSLLRNIQGLLLENTIQIEELQARFNRLR